MSWDPFLMKVLVKKKVCGSREQCTGPTGKNRNTLLLEKNKIKQNADADVGLFICIQTGSEGVPAKYTSVKE